MEHHSLGHSNIHFIKEFYIMLSPQQVENLNQVMDTRVVLLTITASDLHGRLHVSVLTALGSAELEILATTAETLLLGELARVLLN